MKRDPLDRHRPERTAVSFLASVVVHALIALFVFSVATSSSEQSPESFSGGAIMNVSVAVPAPRARVLPKARAVAQPRLSAPHPRVLHELAKFAPTAPPNPTPAPVIAVSSAPIPLRVPTAVPSVASVAASIRVPPTRAPAPRPRPTSAPTAPAATPIPQPTAIPATAAPIVAMTTPVPVYTPALPSQVKIAATPAPRQNGVAPSPGPRPAPSAGPRGTAPSRSTAQTRPVQVPATPRPNRAPGGASKRRSSLNERLRSIIPTAAPSFRPATPVPRGFSVGSILPPPVPEPTPPPDVLAATKYLYVENVASQRWKQSWLGTAPEERYVKMYVTSVKRIGFITWCTGWVLRAPIAGNQKWIIEPHSSFICSGRLQPFSPPTASPSGGP